MSSIELSLLEVFWFKIEEENSFVALRLYILMKLSYICTAERI